MFLRLNAYDALGGIVVTATCVTERGPVESSKSEQLLSVVVPSPTHPTSMTALLREAARQAQALASALEDAERDLERSRERH